MSNFNKIVTNLQQSLSNTENDNLSQTLSAVRTAGGGGGGGTSYGGDGIYIEIVGNNTITLTTTAAEKLNRAIPTKVTELTDSADYATTAYVNGVTGSIYYTNILGLSDALSAKQDKLTFGYDENDSISSINSHKLAGAGGVTGDYYSASNPSGFINSAQAETQILAKKYITSGVSELDNFYSKTDTSSKTELQTKFDSLLDYDVVTGNSAVLITTADANNTRTFTISLTATPTAADTVLNGKNGVDATLNGNVWNVGLSQSAYDAVNDVQNKLDTTAAAQTYQPKGNYYSASNPSNFVTETHLEQELTYYTEYDEFSNLSSKVNGKLDSTAAAQLYQPIGNYLSSNALEGYATQQWVGQQGYITQETDWTNTIQEASAKAYNDATANANSLYQAKGDYVKNTDIGLDANSKVTAISGKELIITAHQSLTNYYTKDQTSGAAQISAALAALPGGGITEVTHDTTLTGKGNSTQDLGVAWSALSGNTVASAEKTGEAQGFRWGDNTYQDTSAALTNLWNTKNHVTLQTANNILTVDNNDNTSATLSAMSYVNNTSHAGWLPQKSCVCQESEIYGMSQLADGQGMLFFVVSAH